MAEVRFDELSVQRGRRWVIEGVSASFDSGRITGVLGPNGAGKSTLLMAVAGILPYEGRISLAGRELSAWSPAERAKQLAYVPQQSGLMAPLPVRAVVAQGRFPHHGPLGRSGRADREAVEWAMARTDVAALSERPFDALSGGEQRRVLLARALATDARAILLDEPTASLDVGHALALHGLLRALADDDYAVAVVLHQLDDARRRTDWVLLLDGGQLVAEGASDEVVAPAQIRETYGVNLVEGGGLGFELVADGEEVTS